MIQINIRCRVMLYYAKQQHNETKIISELMQQNKVEIKKNNPFNIYVTLTIILK